MVMLLAAVPDAKDVPPVHCSVVVYVAALAPPPKVSAGRVMVSPGNTLTWAPLVALGAVELNVALTAAGMGADARRLLDVVAEGEIIARGTEVVVVEVHGSRIVVQPVS